MGCSFGAGQGSAGLGHILAEVVAFFGRLASQVLVILTSGPALGLLTAFVLLLAAVALLKIIFGRRAPPARPAGSEGAR